jgi:hypothetical protein
MDPDPESERATPDWYLLAVSKVSKTMLIGPTDASDSDV